MIKHNTRFQSGRYGISLALMIAMVTAIASDDSRAQSSRSFEIEEVVVTARKRDENIQDVPISISAFSARQLEEHGIGSGREIAHITPNLHWKGDSAVLGNTIFLRGIGNNSFNRTSVSAVGIYADEVYLNAPSMSNSAVFDLDRIEVLRGPQGTLYGRNTTGGAIKYVTKKPEIGAGFNGYAKLTGGNFDRFDQEGAVGFDLGDNAAMRISVKNEAHDGYLDNRFDGGELMDSAWLAGRVQLRVAPTEDLNILLSINGSNVSNSNLAYKQVGLVDLATFGPCPNPGLGSGCSDFFASPPDNADIHSVNSNVPASNEKQELFGGALTLNWSLPWVDLTSVTAYQEIEAARFGEDVDASPQNILYLSSVSDISQYSQEVRLASNNGGDLDWILGFYFFEEDLPYARQAINVPGTGFPLLSGGIAGTMDGIMLNHGQDTTSMAVFGQATYDFNDRISITGGVRYSYEKKTFHHESYLFDLSALNGGNPDSTVVVLHEQSNLQRLFTFVYFDGNPSWSEVTGSASIDYKFTDDILLFFRYARGFKGGEFSGQATFDQAEASVVDPEFIDSYEIGVKSTWMDGRLKLNGAFFYYDFTDQQVFTFVDAATRLENAGASTVYGIDLESQFQATDNLFVAGSLGWLHARYDEFLSGTDDHSDNTLPGAPDLTFNGLVRYEQTVGPGMASIQTTFNYTDDVFFSAINDPILTQDSYWLWNIRASYSWTVQDDHELELTAFAKNLGDKKYITDMFDVGFIGLDLAAPGPPRTYGVSLSYRF